MKNFFNQDWTGKIRLKDFDKFGFWRMHERTCSQVVLDAKSPNGHNQLATNVRAPDMFRMTVRAGLIDADLRHAAIIEKFYSGIDRP